MIPDIIQNKLNHYSKKLEFDHLYKQFINIYTSYSTIENDLLNDNLIAIELHHLYSSKSLYNYDNKKGYDDIYNNLKDNNYNIRFLNGSKIIVDEIIDIDEPICIHLNYDIPKKYDLPEDMKYFYHYMGKSGLKLDKLCNKKTCQDYNTILPINQFCIWNAEIITRQCGEILDNYICDNIIAKIDLNDWIVFYNDYDSVDNGAGELIINLNSESPLFGNILSYTSIDEGLLEFVAKSFTEFIQLLIDVPVKQYVSDELTYEWQCCNSVCDHLNQRCYCWSTKNPNFECLLFNY